MSEDSGSNASSAPAQHVDIDEIEVEILILAKSPNNLNQTCGFLTRRGWPTTVIGNLSKAVEFIAEKRPDFVVISFNHPSPAVLRLPELITQSFNLTCIGFVEGTDPASTARLNNVKLRHKIFGAPSGPSFQRTIRRILAEKFNIKLDEKPSAENRLDKDRSGSVTVRGQKPTQEDSDTQGPSEIFDSSADDQGMYNGNVTLDPRAKGQKPSTAASGPTLVQKSEPGATAGLGAKVFGGEGYGKVMKNVQEETAGAENSDAEPEDDTVTNGKYTMGNKPRRSLKALTGADQIKDAAGNLLFGEALDSAAVTGPDAAVSADLVGMLKKSLFGQDGSGERADLGIHGVLEKAAAVGLGKICKSDPELEPIPLKSVKRLGVFPVDSATLPGYLILAVEIEERETRASFLKLCGEALQTAFQSLAVPGTLEVGFWLDVPEVAFDSWVENTATFQLKMDYEGAEVGVAFFQSERPIPKPKISSEDGMYTVSLDDIATNQPVNFKAYLHFKQNQKYYLYLRNGRQLQEEQKARLQSHKINDVFMKSVDIENLRLFLAGVFIRESIKNSGEAA